MTPLTPLESLLDQIAGDDFPLPAELATLYGPLRFPLRKGRPHVIGNFVTTMDGVASLSAPGLAGGGPISGKNPHDRMVMGLLRSVADAVIVGAGTLRSVPNHLWTAEHIYPPLSDSYRQLRIASGKKASPLNVIVTARGEIDLDLPVFRSGEVKVLIVTNSEGARRVRERGLPASVVIGEVEEGDAIGAREVLSEVGRILPGKIILVEGGPRLMGDFFAGEMPGRAVFDARSAGRRAGRVGRASRVRRGEAVRTGASPVGNACGRQTRRQPPVS